MKKLTSYVLAILLLFACKDSIDETMGIADEATSIHTMVMNFDGDVQLFDQTRATTSFANGTTMYVYFSNGSGSEISGSAVYNSSKNNWELTYTGSLNNMTDASCEMYYIVNPTSTSSSSVGMDFNSAVYSGKGTYTKTASSLNVKCTLSPNCVRLRFKGTSGKTIKVSGFRFFSNFDTRDGDLLTSSTEVSLSIQSSGYTPYIYYWDCSTITLVVDGSTYTMEPNSSMNARGKSGYIVIPTSTNHSGWEEVKEDFVCVAKGQFTENILFKDSWEQPIEYSKSLGIYRLPDLITEDAHVYFVWDGTDADDQLFYMCDANGQKVETFATGYKHPSYGMIMWNVLSENWSGYDSKANAFYFPAEMTVSAGSFGSAYETLEILETYSGWPFSGGGSNKVNGHEYVDLGLSVKWATCNVGASEPEEYGDYYAWGETTTKSTYDWSTYKWCNGSYTSMTKYCTSSSYGTVDNKKVLELADDVARAKWGGTWRMPTAEEQDELRNNCTWTWTTQNGVNGYKVTSKTNSNYIFLPAAGYRFVSISYNVGSYSLYWSSSLDSGCPCYAYCLGFDSGAVDWYYNFRYYGFSVRAVCP